jgi:D-xylonolactonase
MERAVYWTDIPNGKLFRYDVESREHRQVYSGRPVGGLTVQADGQLLLFLDNGSIAKWNGRDLDFVIESMDGELGNRFNDVIADPEGRVFCGTMSNQNTPGRLYRLDTDGSIRMILEGTKTSNGMGFSPDLTKFYFTDTGPGEIYVFDYDRGSGDLSNQTLLIKIDRSIAGAPDGLTVDSEGNIWSTRWDGSKIVKYSPEGKELLEVPFPVKKVSSITFGGDDYTDAFVTTAGGQDKFTNGELAGALFQMRPGVAGVPEFFSTVKL